MRTSTERVQVALNGPTMGTRWSALLLAEPGFDAGAVRAALQAAVDEVDARMSTWKPRSDLMRLNAAPPGIWVAVPDRLKEVLACGLEIGRASGGAFDIGMGDAVTAWGFGPKRPAPDRIRAAMAAPRRPAHEIVEIDGTHVRKSTPIALDLNGIAKGYGVDRLAETLREHGIADALVGIDGEMRALGLRPDKEAWTIAVETPDTGQRAPHSILALHNAAVATSGDYRHWIEVQGQHLSHTMDPTRGAPLIASAASVTVVARTCAEADAWATALMVLGSQKGAALAAGIGLDALFLDRVEGGLRPTRVGRLFEPGAEPAPSSAPRSAVATPPPRAEILRPGRSRQASAKVQKAVAGQAAVASDACLGHPGKDAELLVDVPGASRRDEGGRGLVECLVELDERRRHRVHQVLPVLLGQ